MHDAGTPLPPPPPPAPDDGRSLLWRSIWPTLAVIGVATTAVMSLLWWDARNDSASVTSPTDAGPDLVAELDAARDDLEEARAASADSEAEVERLRTELTDALASLAEAEVALETAPDDEDTAAALETALADVDRLAAERSELESELDAANESLSELEAAIAAGSDGSDAEEGDGATEPDVETGAPDEPEDTDPEQPAPSAEPPTPPSFLELGTTLGGLYRENVLGQGQRRCLGEFAAGRLGADLDVILASDDPGADERLIETLEDASPICRIDPSAIFG